MKQHTIETFKRGTERIFLTFDGQPSMVELRASVSNWFFHRHGHSFTVLSYHEVLDHELASVAVDHFFEPSSARETVDLSRFSITPGSRRGRSEK